MKSHKILNIKNAIIIIVIASIVKLIFIGLTIIGRKYFYPSFPIYGFSTLHLFFSLIIDSVTIIFAVRFFNVDIKEQLNKVRLKTIVLFTILAILIFLLILPLVNPFDFFEKLANHKITVHHFNLMIYEKTNFNIIFYFFLMVIVTPIIEEILYRGIILNLFLKKYSVKISLIVSSLIFAFIHLRFIGFGYLFLDGLLLGFAYYKTKSLFTSILLHFLRNLMAVTTSNQYIELNNTTFPKYFLYTVVLLTAAFIVLKSLNKGANSIKFVNKIFTRKGKSSFLQAEEQSEEKKEI